MARHKALVKVSSQHFKRFTLLLYLLHLLYVNPYTNINMSSTNTDKATTSSNNKSSKGEESNRRNNRFKKPVIRQAKFEGKTTDLKGNIYDCIDSRQSEQYTKTTKEISEYVGRTYKYGGDARMAIEKLKLPELVEPVYPGDNSGRSKIHVWEKEIDEFVCQKNYLNENIKTLYSLVWGQCSDIIRTKLESLDTFTGISDRLDSIMLIKEIKGIVFNFQSQKYKPQALQEAVRRFYSLQQGRDMSTQSFLDRFQNNMDVIEHGGGTVGMYPGLQEAVLKEQKIDKDTADDPTLLAAVTIGQERFIACAFLFASDRGRFGKLLEDLENGFLQDQNNYPDTLTQAYNLLINWKQTSSNFQRYQGPINDGVAFTTKGDERDEREEGDERVALTNATGEKKSGYQGNNFDIMKVKCHKCGKPGHYEHMCTNDDKKEEQMGTQLLMAGVMAGEFEAFTFTNTRSRTAHA